MTFDNTDEKQTSSLAFSFEAPTPEEFVKFRSDCGWGEIEHSTAKAALAASVFDVTCRSDGELVGLARVVGDGVLYYYVQDVIVRSDWRGCAVGQRMMTLLMDRIKENAISGATIGLMAAKGKEEFYKHFGFDIRPTDRLGAGMTQFVLR